MKISKTSLMLAAAPALLSGALVALPGCGASSSSATSAGSAVTGAGVDTTTPLALTEEERAQMVRTKTTCPFVGTALMLKNAAGKFLLDVFGSKEDPFAKIGSGAEPGSIGWIGDQGGGDISLGFQIVARGNHHKSPSGVEAPAGFFSLDFPTTQGAHPGASFILMGDPTQRNSGRFKQQNLDRLIKPQSAGGHAETAPDGTLVIRRSELGKFAARNVACDPNSTAQGSTLIQALNTDVLTLANDSVASLDQTVEGTADPNEVMTRILQDLLHVAIQDSLVIGAAEFTLLTTMLAPSTKAVTMPDTGEPAIAVEDIQGIFDGDLASRRYPEGWMTQSKTALDFIKHFVHVMHSAGSWYYLDRDGLLADYPADTCPVGMSDAPTSSSR